MCMIVKIDKLSHDFRGITRLNDKVTFVSDTLPGEVVDIRLISSKKSINEGMVISYIETSSNRIKPICPYSNLCGGCDTCYIDYDKAIIYKKEIVVDIMKRYADIDIDPEIVYDNNIYGYRNKISLRVKDGKLALVKEGSNEFVNISKCLLVNDNINNVIDIFSNIDLTGVNSVVIKGVNEIMVVIEGDIDSNIIIDNLKDVVNSIILNNKVIYGNKYISIDVDDTYL